MNVTSIRRWIVAGLMLLGLVLLQCWAVSAHLFGSPNEPGKLRRLATPVGDTTGASPTDEYANPVNWTLDPGVHPIASYVPTASDAVILVMGQSNMAQYTNYTYTATHASSIHEFLYGDGTKRDWVEPVFGPPSYVTLTGAIHGNDTLDGLSSTAGLAVGNNVSGFGLLSNTTVTAIVNSTTVTIAPAATVTTSGGTYSFSSLVGSWFGQLADKLINAGKFNHVIFCFTALGGTLASDWGPAGKYHSVYTTALKRLRAAGLPITMIIVGQGETENFLGLDGTAWTANWKANVKISRDFGYNGPWFFAEQTWNIGTTSTAIQAAQLAIVDNAAGIYSGPNLDVYGSSYRYDNTHLNASGGDAVSSAWEAVITAHSF